MIETLDGAALEAALPDLARLRIEVFAEWPYLYAGDAAYEARYLAAYARSDGAMVAVARDGGRIVGAATAAPLEDQDAAFVAALRPHHAPETVFYCGESVLLPAYRGRGLGHAFFDAREARGRALGRAVSAFCAVERPADHPARPAAPRDLGPFWRGRGYAPLDAVARFAWTDLGATEETEKPMRFWSRRL